jgi:hypothetical protein
VSLISTLGGIATGFLSGGPAGAVAGGIMGAFGGGSPRTPAIAAAPMPPSGSPFGIGVGINAGGPNGITLRLGTPNVVNGSPTGATGQPRGYHLNKHPLAACKSHGAMPARSMWVRNRRMNPLNPRALRKALHREKAARHLMGKLHIFKAHRSLAPRRKK